ncbi:MAG: LysR family transcriptional regulator [Pseudomonadota bacterium]
MTERWDDLRIFLSVMRHGGLTGAARALRLDPATVGRRIAALEQRLDRVLFVKSPQGYAPTEEAARLTPRIEEMEAALRAGVEGLGNAGDGLSGAIRIGAPDGCANYLLPGICAEIGRSNPDLDIQIIAMPREVNLSRREADMAITVSQPTGGRLMVQPIADYDLHLAAARGYLQDAPPLATPQDLHAHRIVGYIPDMIFDSELDYLTSLGLTRVAAASTSAAVQVQMLEHGCGVGVVHGFAMPSAPNLVPVLPDIRFQRRYYLVRHADDRRSDRMQRFADLLVAGMRAALTQGQATTQD